MVGVLPLESRSELPTHTLRAIEKVRELSVKILSVTIDAGFFSAEIISYLQKEFEKNKLKYHNPDANQPKSKEDEASGWQEVHLHNGR